MKIKKVTLQDLKKIVDLERKIFEENAFSKQTLKRLIEDNEFFLKIEIGKLKKVLAGFVIAIKDRKDRANIINFLINPKFQNHGIGTILLRKMIEEIRTIKDIKKIVLNVNVNNHNAIKLYKKHHFKITKEIENYYNNGESSYLMELNN
jgi:ribosomal protein S18 acetylase RimI-like enzyme